LREIFYDVQPECRILSDFRFPILRGGFTCLFRTAILWFPPKNGGFE
jgi:hypothetical protein